MKVTVAVPTIKGRSKYLASCLRTCVSQDEDCEIVVSDNSEGDAREVVDSFDDRRVRYVSPPTYLPMSAHWDFVLTKVTGDVVCIIGDDDGLMPGCITRAREILSQIGDIPLHHALANYRWLDFIDVNARNSVEFLHDVGKRSGLTKSVDFLSGVAEARVGYLDGPMVYHNFVPTRLLRRLSHDGVFFRRASPDVYSSVAIAANTDAFFHTEELLTISGQGAKANGAAIQAGGGHEFLVEMKKLYTPRFGGRSVQMHLLDSYIEVAEYFDRPELLAAIKYQSHIAGVIAESRHMNRGARSAEVRAALGLAHRQRVLTGSFLSLANRGAEKVKRALIRRRPAPAHTFSRGQVVSLGSDVKDIFDAARAVDALLANASSPISPDHDSPKAENVCGS